MGEHLQREVGILETAPAGDMAFCPEGMLLATANTDSTIRIWDVGILADLLGAVCAIAGRGNDGSTSPVDHRLTCGP
ncbi:hypothetical protein GT755_02420 [Herbidospora sp. NEAU-GS84]|uniref:Uncharacterized protein n=1 Tax=Herbidospora solisilvae TaxID=2696284 RepID=A0A7C9NBR3_9ACTN|nr:WD40 repeat domain-containing protein [Herbidospora solisilvae]NAS20535.1 hypothetical protein [Herbidospora solisilvae]